MAPQKPIPPGAIPDPQMVDAMTRSGRWVAILAREPRDPMSAIKICLEGLRAPCVASREPQSILTLAGDGTTHMAPVIEDVLESCRIGWARTPLDTEGVNLSGVIAIAVRTARPLVKSRGHRPSIVPSHPRILASEP